MKRTVIVCDYCKKELADGEARHIDSLDLCEIHYGLIVSQAIDTCEKARGEKKEDEALKISIEGMKEYYGENAVEKEDIGSRTYSYDWNMACALKNAGFPHKEISEETKIPKAVIDSCIYKYLKKYNTGFRFKVKKGANNENNKDSE